MSFPTLEQLGEMMRSIGFVSFHTVDQPDEEVGFLRTQWDGPSGVVDMILNPMKEHGLLDFVLRIAKVPPDRDVQANVIHFIRFRNKELGLVTYELDTDHGWALMRLQHKIPPGESLTSKQFIDLMLKVTLSIELDQTAFAKMADGSSRFDLASRRVVDTKA